MTRCSQEAFCTLFSVLFTFLSLGILSSNCQSKWEADPEADVDEESGFASKGTLSFQTPDLDDEDHYSDHLPSDLKCDACNILAHLFSEKFNRAITNQPSLKGKLPESQVLDLLESVCSDEFNQVGIKEVKGVKRLAGPGLATKDIPGIMQGGGKWPRRMQQICKYYLGEPGDDEIFEAFTEGNLKEMLCYEKGRYCNEAKKTSKKSKKSKKAKKTKPIRENKTEL